MFLNPAHRHYQQHASYIAAIIAAAADSPERAERLVDLYLRKVCGPSDKQVGA